MSQAGLVDVIGSHPEIPIVFDANTGSATPAGNILNILGTGVISTSGSGNTITISATSSVTETLTGNSGGAVSPTANNINTIGTGSITIVGNPGTSTLTTQLTGLTNHSVQVGAGTSTLTQLAVGTNGQVLIGATGADPAFATLTSSDSSISFTPGANSLSLQVAGGTTSIKTITGNSGGAESPSAGNFNILGTGSITVAGSANTETVQLTGLTNHAIQIGAGTATLTQLGSGTTGQVLQTNTTADPTWSTATYPSTTTINQVLYSSASNTVSGLATANNGVFITGATGVPSWLANGTTGQILTATTGSPPSWSSSPASAFTSVVRQVFTGTGTYTPTSGMLYCDIEAIGGGGGSGGCQTTGVGNFASSGGGGGGGYSRKIFTAATIGASKSVTIGAGGTAGSAGANNGGTGGTTSVGATILSATGGVGGTAGFSTAGLFISSGGAGGSGSSGDFNTSGAPGGFAIYGGTLSIQVSGFGGSSFFGGGSASLAGAGAAVAGASYGGGAAGGGIVASSGQIAGAAGAAGIVIITEYI